jgi:hypothetical protein
MTYFHATTIDRIPSILAHGLGAAGAARWPAIERGVYLAEAAEHAVYVLLDWFRQAADDAASPREFIEAIRVIVIDDARVPRALLGPDPDIPREGIWLYRGGIDVRNMPIIPIDTLAAEWSLGIGCL